MKQWLKNFNVMRLLRLAMGIAIIYQGVLVQQWQFVILGGVFSLLPLLNIGCCSTNNCTTNLAKKQNNKKTTFTEIK